MAVLRGSGGYTILTGCGAEAVLTAPAIRRERMALDVTVDMFAAEDGATSTRPGMTSRQIRRGARLRRSPAGVAAAGFSG